MQSFSEMQHLATWIAKYRDPSNFALFNAMLNFMREHPEVLTEDQASWATIEYLATRKA